MRTTFRMTIVSLVVSLVSMSAFPECALAATTPQEMHISCTAPNPKHQTGLHRPKGDSSHWIFSIVLEGGARFVGKPHWTYPSSDNNDPNWGLVIGGKDGDSSMDWSSPGKTGEFKVRVSGQITCGKGGNGAPIDFSVGWNAEVVAKKWKAKPAIEGGILVKPQDQTKDPVEPENVVVLTGAVLTCTVESATDTDYWEETDGDGNILNSGYEADGDISYRWSATDGKGTFADSDQASTTWAAPIEPGTYTLSCKIDDPHADGADPEVTGVSEEEDGSRNDEAITRSVTVTVVKVEMANPTGDPTKSTEAAENQNEFTFNTASPGVLTIQCRATLVPDNPITQSWAKENISWVVSDIIGSTKSWVDRAGEAANNKGKEVNCLFTNLPSSNAAFGLKTVTMTVRGEDTVRNIEVFFDRDATNHPSLANHPMAGQLQQLGSVPWKNWMYYWLQTVSPLGPNPQFIVWPSNQAPFYKPENDGGYLGIPGKIHLTSQTVSGPIEAPYSEHNPLTGIDAFAWMIIHESQHYKDWVDFWSNDADIWNAQKGLTGANDDKDGDRIPNKIEDKDLSGTYNIGDLYDWDNYNTPTQGRSPLIINDFEDWACKRHTAQKGDYTKDWAAPGMQHKTNNTWND